MRRNEGCGVRRRLYGEREGGREVLGNSVVLEAVFPCQCQLTLNEAVNLFDLGTVIRSRHQRRSALRGNRFPRRKSRYSLCLLLLRWLCRYVAADVLCFTSEVSSCAYKNEAAVMSLHAFVTVPQLHSHTN